MRAIAEGVEEFPELESLILAAYDAKVERAFEAAVRAIQAPAAT
jgi:hypothetical protein